MKKYLKYFLKSTWYAYPRAVMTILGLIALARLDTLDSILGLLILSLFMAIILCLLITICKILSKSENLEI